MNARIDTGSLTSAGGAPSGNSPVAGGDRRRFSEHLVSARSGVSGTRTHPMPKASKDESSHAPDASKLDASDGTPVPPPQGVPTDHGAWQGGGDPRDEAQADDGRGAATEKGIGGRQSTAESRHAGTAPRSTHPFTSFEESTSPGSGAVFGTFQHLSLGMDGVPPPAPQAARTAEAALLAEALLARLPFGDPRDRRVTLTFRDGSMPVKSIVFVREHGEVSLAISARQEGAERVRAALGMLGERLRGRGLRIGALTMD
jgi:hypothetical protein